ncbi:MAG TPA: CHAT domain-containing protein, partial [Candidatus Eisenbacteria bacterium]|nr:CHAT domain-containing protein [Candidatus Eisenbacteria bacterium]
AVNAEAGAIAQRFPRARVLAGAEATAARVLALAPRAAWIHFAGHGAWQPGIPEASALRLADRWVTAAELAAGGLAARWVSLSACQSARSLASGGEEWFGMPRTLLLAGAGAVVASQWDIADADAAELAVTLYDGLSAGLPPGEALRRAQVARRRVGVHPMRWAGFVQLAGPAMQAGFGSRIHPARTRGMV